MTRAMRRSRAALVGGLSGALGMAAMDALWYHRQRRKGGTQTPLEWEFSAGVTTWDDVSAPGKVGHRLLRSVRGDDVPDRWARPTQNAVHWATGFVWGAQYGVIAASIRHRRAWWGLALGVTSWATSYVVLPLTGIYKPPWEYDAAVLGEDLSAHLLYGAATGAAFAAATRRP
jgi:hypothetical protein